MTERKTLHDRERELRPLLATPAGQLATDHSRVAGWEEAVEAHNIFLCDQQFHGDETSEGEVYDGDILADVFKVGTVKRANEITGGLSSPSKMPAPETDHQCGECRECWNRGRQDGSYRLH